MKNTMHYNGFIDTCVAYGMDKEAAARIYKEAVGAGFLKAIGRGIGHLFNAGVKTKEVGKAVGKATVDTATRWGRNVADVTSRAARATGEAVKDFGTAVKTNVGSGFRQVAPTARMATPSSLVKNKGPGFWSNVGHMMNPSTYIKPTIGFVGRHPLIGSAGLIGGTAYLTNKANMAGANGKAFSKVPTLTPSQKRTLDRMNSGMNLPGLGLDPAYFKGSYY